MIAARTATVRHSYLPRLDAIGLQNAPAAFLLARRTAVIMHQHLSANFLAGAAPKPRTISHQRPR